jgi:hypothetical protein
MVLSKPKNSESRRWANLVHLFFRHDGLPMYKVFVPPDKPPVLLESPSKKDFLDGVFDASVLQ